MRLLVLDGPERVTPKFGCEDVMAEREPCPEVRMGCALLTVLALLPVQLFVMPVDRRAPLYGVGAGVCLRGAIVPLGMIAS